MTGTSMASPHVAGAAALYLAANGGATPQQVRDALVTNGSADRLGNVGTGSPNVLLYTPVSSTVASRTARRWPTPATRPRG